MEMPGHLRPWLAAHGFVAEDDPADLDLVGETPAAMVGEAGVVVADDPDPVEPRREAGQQFARRGRQPEVPTSGKRKGYKVFGAIAYGSGRLFYQGIEGRFNSEQYQGFLQALLAQTQAHLFLIHDGARYHTSQATMQFLAQHAERLTGHPLPSYSPDDNPIEYLWKKASFIAQITVC